MKSLLELQTEKAGIEKSLKKIDAGEINCSQHAYEQLKKLLHETKARIESWGTQAGQVYRVM
jgi:hypothetical protein